MNRPSRLWFIQFFETFLPCRQPFYGEGGSQDAFDSGTSELAISQKEA